MRHINLAAAALLGCAAIACALPAVAQPTPLIEVSDAWARATTSMARAGGVFLTLTATGGTDRVASVSSPVAETIELHETINDGGVMRMRPVPFLEVVPGTPAVLKPGGAHIMLLGLKRPLRRGETFPITVIFEKAPTVTATVTVQSAGASGSMHHR